jgi:hypothetical protein
MGTRIIGGHVVKEYGEDTKNHHYDVHEYSGVASWWGERIASGLKDLSEVRAVIRDHNEEVRERNSKK